MIRTSSQRGARLAAAVTVALSLVAGGLVGASSAQAAKTINIAYLSASSANTWLQASKAEMDKIAKKNGMKITEFDAQFKPGEQAKQIQDVLASKKYKAIIIASVDGAGIIPSLQDAVSAGLKVGILNQVVGTKLDTAKPQFKGPSVVVMVPPKVSGQRVGKLTLKACEGVNPCRVVYFYGIKGIPLDTAIKDRHPTMPTLLQEIWRALKAQPENVTLMTEEEIGVIVSGLQVQTNVSLAQNMSKQSKSAAATKSVAAKINQLGLDAI